MNKGILLKNLDSREIRLGNVRTGRPLPMNLISCKQFYQMKFGPWFLSCLKPNNCVFLNDLTAILIKNIVQYA